MANTTIQLKYSNATATPVSLAQGETAYSNNSNKLFVGLSSGAIVAIGGQYYTGLIDAATNLNTASAIVKSDASGNFSAGTITAASAVSTTAAVDWVCWPCRQAASPRWGSNLEFGSVCRRRETAPACRSHHPRRYSCCLPPRD